MMDKMVLATILMMRRVQRDVLVTSPSYNDVQGHAFGCKRNISRLRLRMFPPILVTVTLPLCVQV